MAKKKDTLKDLNDFMKSQSTEKSGGSEDFLSQQPTRLADVDSLKKQIQSLDSIKDGDLLENEIIGFVSKVADLHGISQRQVLYRICEKVLDKQSDSEPNDIMLHNIVLYLKHQDLLLQKLKS